MADITVRVLEEDEWQLYRQARLAALKDAPEAFIARFQEEASYGEDVWRVRMIRARRIVAERDDELVGLACLGLHGGDPETGEVFGLWTAPTARGERAAWDLVSAAVRKAAEDGCRMLYFWAGSDNAAAVGLAGSCGFRPTGERRPMRVADDGTEQDADGDGDGDGADEVAMVLPLSVDPRQPANPYLD